MFTHTIASGFEDFFSGLSARGGKNVYFYRISGYSTVIDALVRRFYSLSLKNGSAIEGSIPSPDQKNLSYYREVMGDDFKPTLSFMDSSLKKWLPRLGEVQRHDMARALLETFQDMIRAGKNESIIRNTYIKFLCWLYYRFDSFLDRLGCEDLPKLIYEGEISNHELLFLSVLSKCGCDILLIQKNGDSDYLRLDPNSEKSTALPVPEGGRFPEDFCLKKLKAEIERDAMNARLYGPPPKTAICTNAWIGRQRGLEIIKEPSLMRGKDASFAYNAFVRINGAEDKYIYSDQLYRLQQDLKNSKRRLVIVNGKIPNPTNEEISLVKRGNYASVEQMISGLSQNVAFPANAELQKMMRRAFVDVLLEDSRKDGASVSRSASKAVHLVSWLARYSNALFAGWRMPEIGCFIHFGGCGSENEALFLKFLARLPVDVLILCPSLDAKCRLEDPLLYEENNAESADLDRFPEDSSQVRMGTVASHAEREMMGIMSSDSNGLYGNKQFSRADSITLRTMYEEIRGIWDVEVKFRQFFRIEGNRVNIPVIFAKISGIRDGNEAAYWNSIRSLKTPNSILITKIPYIAPGTPNKFKGLATEFLRNGKIQRERIKEHPDFRYSILREEMQDHIIDKIEQVLRNRLIKGIGENGTEYSVIGWCLNLPEEIVRMIQSFDFTKKNPKLLFVCAGEEVLSLEDSIIVSLLNLVGFDIIFFVPTGYQCVERHFSERPFEEHQIGDYRYALQVPDLTAKEGRVSSILGKFFGKP